MFIKDKYYNEKNISTIEFSVETSYEDFEIRSIWLKDKFQTQDWLINKTNQTFKELTWGNKTFNIQTDEYIENLKSETSRIKSNRRYTVDDCLSIEQEIKEATNNKLIQDELFSKEAKHEYVFNEGNIVAHIKMNNEDLFDVVLLYWCHKQSYRDGKIHTDSKIDRVYEDSDVTIEYVYEILGNKPIKKEYI